MKPTRLYIKKHTKTGLKYFGKTTKDPFKYMGSGLHWTRHIKKHGKEHIITEWISEPFTDKDSITEFATFMSEELNVVESNEWANMKIENGLDGGNDKGHGKGVSKPGSGNKLPKSDKWIQVMTARKGILVGPYSEERKAALRKPKSGKGAKGIQKEKIVCPHCSKVGGINIMHRHHFNNCKLK